MTYLERVRRMKELGYSVEIIFLRLTSPELAIKRVAHRVKQGGHHEPAEDVRRRFARGWRNLKCITVRWLTSGRCTRTLDLHPFYWTIPMTKALKKAEAQAFLVAVGKAMKAAAKEARRVSKIHGTKVWVMKDGKIVGLDP